MKKTKYFAWMIAAGLVMTGCSDELDTPNTPTILDTEGGYVKVAINLPTTSGMGTKAENDKFDDGIANEYAVGDDGIIVYFAAPTSTQQNPTDEDDATFVGAYPLPTGGWNVTADDDAITATRSVIAEAPNVEGDIYALVILNPNSVASDDATDRSLTINGVEYAAGSTTLTLAKLREKLTNQNVSNYVGASRNRLTMMNAPLAEQYVTKSTSNVKTSTLVPVTVYPSEDDANVNDPAIIHVERVVAKVTLTGFSLQSSGKFSGKCTKAVNASTGTTDDIVVFEAWDLDVTNKSTKFIHDVYGKGTDGFDYWQTLFSTKDGNNSRFVAAANPFRIYWAVDGNYDGLEGYGDPTTNTEGETTGWEQEFNYVSEATTTTLETTDNEAYPLYCFENTFNIGNMNHNQSTRVLIKATYYLDPEAAVEADFYTCSNLVTSGGVTGGAINVTDFLTAVNNALNNTEETDKITTEDLDNTGSEAGIYKTADEIKALLGLEGATADDDAQTIINQLGEIRYYQNGTSFYYVPLIEHFGDTYTADRNSEGEYTSEAESLGRYGVVRNNWYEVNIASISGPGEPIIPEPTPDPDGGTGYVRAEIRMLSWAKRVQNVDL